MKRLKSPAAIRDERTNEAATQMVHLAWKLRKEKKSQIINHILFKIQNLILQHSYWIEQETMKDAEQSRQWRAAHRQQSEYLEWLQHWEPTGEPRQ